jgi:hypothetical protein
VPIALKSGSLNLLEPSGPVQACNGIALPLPFIYSMKIGVQVVYENIRFGLLEFKHDGIVDFATPGNTRATTQTQIQGGKKKKEKKI